MPGWVSKVFTHRISPGLDIRGGLRMVYEVEVDEAIRDRRNAIVDQLNHILGEKFSLWKKDDLPSREQLDKLRARVRVSGDPTQYHIVRVSFTDAKDMVKLDRDTVKRLGDVQEKGKGDKSIALGLNEERLDELRRTAVEQAVKTITNRIDELQIRETAVSSRGDEVIIEVPGADEAAFSRIRDIVSRTARLEFKITDDENDFVTSLNDIPQGIEKRVERAPVGPNRPESQTSYLFAKGKKGKEALSKYIAKLQNETRIPDDHQLLLGKFEGEADPKAAAGPDWRTYYVFARAEITGDYIDEAFVTFDERENSKPAVALNFNPAGADVFARLTERNVKRRMAIVLDNQIDAAPPVISEKIPGGHARISMGGFRSFEEIRDEAQDLVVVLRAGALPAPIRLANQQHIGATLGKDSVRLGALGAVAGVGLVLLFMLAYYEVVGIAANIAVILNILYLLAVLAFFEGTLTLPGIAGIALTVGMAVDANVLINERIREELLSAKTPRLAVEQGYQRAFSSIFDSQLTTMIAGVVLLQYGTGPIKGFAVTLIIGIVTSIFTAVFCSKVVMDWFVRGIKVKRLRAG